MQSTDEQLITQTANEDANAFATLYDRHAPRLYGLLRRMLGDSADADDLIQEVFWQVWSKAKKFDPLRGTARAWLTMIARSQALDQLRRKGRQPASFEILDQIDMQSSPGVNSETAERARAARAALDRLQKNQRQAIQMAFFDGLTHSEIAVRENLPLGTVKTRIRDGMIRLRDALSASIQGEP